jgi:cell division protein FtsQ
MAEMRSEGGEVNVAPFFRPAARGLGRRSRNGLRLRGRRLARFAALAALAAGVVAARHGVLHARALAVRSVHFTGAARVGPARLESVATRLRGENLIALDLTRVEQQLKRLSPWVESATVRRVLPDRLEVEIVERRPVAQLTSLGALLAADGVRLPLAPAAPGDAALPVVLTAPTIAPDPAALGRAIQLLSLLAGGTRPLLARVAAIDLSAPDDAVLRLTDVNYAVHLGDGDFVARLNRYQNAAPLLAERYPGIATVDLRFRDRVVVSPVPRAAREASGGQSSRSREGTPSL